VNQRPSFDRACDAMERRVAKALGATAAGAVVDLEPMLRDVEALCAVALDQVGTAREHAAERLELVMRGLAWLEHTTFQAGP
jgi:hypothetical protein